MPVSSLWPMLGHRDPPRSRRLRVGAPQGVVESGHSGSSVRQASLQRRGSKRKVDEAGGDRHLTAGCADIVVRATKCSRAARSSSLGCTVTLMVCITGSNRCSLIDIISEISRSETEGRGQYQGQDLNLLDQGKEVTSQRRNGVSAQVDSNPDEETDCVRREESKEEGSQSGDGNQEQTVQALETEEPV